MHEDDSQPVARALAMSEQSCLRGQSQFHRLACGKTHPAPNAKQPPHELSSDSSSMHSKPTLNQSARLFKLLSSVEMDAGVMSSR